MDERHVSYTEVDSTGAEPGVVPLLRAICRYAKDQNGNVVLIGGCGGSDHLGAGGKRFSSESWEIGEIGSDERWVPRTRYEVAPC